MASYYDEHNCEPMQDGEQPNHLLHLARLLIDGGYARDWGLEFDSVFAGQRPPPAASKEAVKELPFVQISKTEAGRGFQCPVCLGQMDEGESAKEMPCKHKFHPTCIFPWLEKTNSCPVCRYELPTDDPDYEEYKKQKKRQKQRDYELESLHSSMFG